MRLIILHGFDDKRIGHSLQVTEATSIKDVIKWRRKNGIKGLLFYKVFLTRGHKVEGKVLNVDNKLLRQLKEG